MAKSDLPFGSEFSPAVIDLRRVLELSHRHKGTAKEFEATLQRKYFGSYDEDNRATLAMNCRLSLKGYRLIDEEARLTEIGRSLLECRNDEALFYATFAKHILLNLNGATFVQCVMDMHTAGEKIRLQELCQWLNERGIRVGRGSKLPSTMRCWLEKAGVFDTRWRVNQDRFREILGASAEEVDSLAMLSSEQRAYLKALINTSETGPFQSNAIERLAAATYGVRFNEKNLPKSVLYPLEKSGWILLQRGTAKGGRGAKPFLVTPTPRLNAEIVGPLLEQVERLTAADIRPLLRKPLAEIRIELESTDRHVAGLALEALAFKLMRLIDLTYVATRLRGVATGGAEVDLIFESNRLVFSRWQIQCKNTSRVSLDDVAKEVGLTKLTHSNVIVMVSTGDIGADARRYSNRVMVDTNLCIVMIDQTDLAAIERDPTAIVSVLNREARQAMEIKRLEL